MKKLKWMALAASAAMLTAGVYSCKGVKDAKDNISSAQDFTSAETEFSGTFDISDDLAQTEGKIKKGGTGILPSGAVLTWIDSTFLDGDGVDFSVDFGALGTTAPKGMLCNDGKYRSGVVHYSLTKRYSEIGASLTISVDAADKFYTGDGTNMFNLSGSLNVTRSALDSVNITMSNGKLVDPDGKTLQFQGSKAIKVISGLMTPGIWGDEYRITGSGSGVNREGDSYTWAITTPLIKKLDAGCARTFIVGVIEVQNTTASTSLKVDFDPYKNKACDRIAKAIIGSREFIFTVR
ncbi:MAG: hypothetical protein JNL57_09285 [Bacteroidetes bacterium]|nr:hypothetical protein [Bacteroidota bacterium]